MPEVITDNLDLWTSALLTKFTAGRGSNGKLEAYGINKLRELILELAVRGKLVPQDQNDEPASALLTRIQAEKARLIAEGKIKKDKPLPQIGEEEKPYVLPQSWEWVRLPEIYFSISPSGGKLLSSAIKDAGAFPVVDQGQRYIAGYTDNDALLITLPGPVIVFGDHTTERKYIDFDFVAGADGVKILRPILQDEHFFFRQLQGYRLEERGYARHFKVLNEKLYALPPIEEQHRIAAKVDELMALCDQLEQQQTDSLAAHQTLVETLLRTLTRVESQQEFSEAWACIANHFDTLFITESSIDRLKQTILQLAVMGKLVQQDPNDEPASVLLERIAIERDRLVSEGQLRKLRELPSIGDDEELADLPAGWAWAFIPQVVTDDKYAIKRGPFGSAIRKDFFVSSGYKVYEQQHAIKDDFSLGEYYVDEHKFNELKAFEVKPNDIIISCSGTVGKVAVAPAWMEPGVINQALLKLSLNEGALTNDYFKILFTAFYMQTETLSELQGTAQKNMVSVETLKHEPFPLPPLAEQRRIVAKVDELEALCDALKTRIADAQITQMHFADAIVEQAVS